VCGDYCGDSNNVIVQWYCVLLESIVVTATVDIVQCYCVVLEFIQFTATVVKVQLYCVVL